jgi:hypothetical protein
MTPSRIYRCRSRVERTGRRASVGLILESLGKGTDGQHSACLARGNIETMFAPKLSLGAHGAVEDELGWLIEIFASVVRPPALAVREPCAAALRTGSDERELEHRTQATT